MGGHPQLAALGWEMAGGRQTNEPRSLASILLVSSWKEAGTGRPALASGAPVSALWAPAPGPSAGCGAQHLLLTAALCSTPPGGRSGLGKWGVGGERAGGWWWWVPSTPALWGEGADGFAGLKPGVLGDGLLPPGNAEEVPALAAAHVLPQLPSGVRHGLALWWGCPRSSFLASRTISGGFSQSCV